MKEKKLSNYEYMKTLDIELFHAVLGGLMDLSMNRYDEENIALMKWLKAEEQFTNPDAMDKALAVLMKEGENESNR